MSKHYKRGVCQMCPSKEPCDMLRWNSVCGACPESLKCMAGPGVGHASCDKIRAAWRDLAPRCMLTSQLVEKRATQGQDDFFKGRQGRTFCPRCGFAFFDVAVDHKLNHHFRRETKYIGVCDYCGVDETITLD